MDQKTSRPRISSYLEKPDRFYGTQMENPISWLRQMDLFYLGLGKNDEETLLVAAMLLRGTAASWWHTATNNITNWASFKVEFEEFFVSEGVKDNWRYDLDNLKQGDMTVNELQIQLEELFTCLKITDDATKKKHLFSALDPVMAYEVGKLRPISFAVAIQDARQMEVLKNRLHNSHGLAQPKQNDNMAPPSQRSVPYEASAIQSAEDSLEMMNRNFKSLKIHLAQHPQQVDPRISSSGLGLVEGASHSIPLVTDKPIHSKPYRLTWQEDLHMQKELSTMLDLGFIRTSSGQWTSPVFFVKKRSGDLRMVIDYRKLNSITVKDTYPLPLIDELLDSLGGAKIFSTLDAASDFWQIPMDEASIYKTGFVTKHGTFEFLTMPFGPTSAPSTFQRTMAHLLRDYIGKFNTPLISLWSSRFANKPTYASNGPSAILAVNLWNTLVILCMEMVFLPAPRNVNKLLDMSPPRSIDEIRSFLGTAGYYRRFIPQFASLALPLTNLLKKNNSFTWTDACTNAVTKLKEALTSPPLLSYPDPEQVQQVLTTDASGRG
ncbi:hypothetical protein [Absidia glauca]|uniref:Reverse transcriptase domain-containing protein n=1 Tax=Absidia glauca TaxID=4829 RepID=A0A163JC45_ABSGL|nr:hypothetical protein [Absidia glauca]